MDARGLAAGWTKAKRTESKKHTGRPQRLTTGGWKGREAESRERPRAAHSSNSYTAQSTISHKAQRSTNKVEKERKR